MPLLFSWVCAALAGLTIANTHLRGKSPSIVQPLACAWLVAASVSAWIGLLQYFGMTDWAGSWLNHTGFGEAYGNLRQRNQFGTLMNIGLAALLWWVASTRTTPVPTDMPTSSRKSMLLPLALAILISAGNATSSSRTGLMQLVLLSLLTLVWQRQVVPFAGHVLTLRPVYQVLLVALLGYAAATVLLPILAGLDPSASGAWARLRSGDPLCYSRLTLWGNVLHLIAQNPWQGWGWGELDYAHFITLYPGVRFCDILDNAHNLPLHLAVELGLPMAILVCGLAVWLIWCARPWRELDATRQMAWCILAVIGLHSLLEYPLWYGPFQMAAVSSVFLLYRNTSKLFERFRPLTYYSLALVAIVYLAFCLAFAWNYQMASQIYLAPESRMSDYKDNTEEKIRNVMFFQDQVRFANLTTTELTTENANRLHALALDMLHFSPEARVVELVLQSSSLLGRSDEVRFYAARYQAAFPDAYALWIKKEQAR